jgi:hypothetical protein
MIQKESAHFKTDKETDIILLSQYLMKHADFIQRIQLLS